MDLLQLQYQCELYKLLLNSSAETADDINVVINSVLELIIKITHASIGYIQLENNNGIICWPCCDNSNEEIKTIKKRISSSIIAEALEFDETIVTPAAYLDPRFDKQASVQQCTIKAVLCSPIRTPDFNGVIYLEGDKSFYTNNKNNLMQAEMFTKHISPLLGKLKYQISKTKSDFCVYDTYQLNNIIAESPVFIDVINEAMSLASLNTTILLMGKTGTGKTQIAKSIHQNSPRKNGSFIHLNCANFPEHLVESELFGSVKGAHSNAHTDINGKIAAADKGTLFLDEIGELPMNIQAKFLQFLEEGFYYPLGSSKPVAPDIRIITASNIDFEKAISEKTFREDLYYRINVFSLTLPPLAERKEDIYPLINFFIKKYSNQFNLPKIQIQIKALVFLQQYDWSGNIRQLKNIIQQAFVRASRDHSSEIMIEHINLPYKEADSNLNDSLALYHEEKNNWEKIFILKQLENNKWNISKTSKNIGLSRSHINTLIKNHNLDSIIQMKKKGNSQ